MNGVSAEVRAHALLRDGQAAAALAPLQDAVRAAPGNPSLRVFLAQLLMVLGAWERAVAQLQVAAQLDAANAPMAHTYRLAIAAEKVRTEVFSGRRHAPLLGEPAPWMARLLDAVAGAASHAATEVSFAEQVSDALADAPEISGTLDGQPFDWLGDADMRLGPMFELIVNGSYYWVPGQSVRALRFDPPKDLRDFVWVPAEAEWRNGGTAPVLMPARYPGSEHGASALQLGRRTEFMEMSPGLWAGLGQRAFASSLGDHALLDVRVIAFDPE